jgi:hypothetical protein
MVSLSQDNKGKYRARKRLPDDVREEYGRLYGARHEAKFSAPNDLTKQEAIRRYGEWLAEIEARISSIRAQRYDQGMSSTRVQTRALAGDWYHLFIERHPLGSTQVWLDLKEKVQSPFHYALRKGEGAKRSRRTVPKKRRRKTSFAWLIRLHSAPSIQCVPEIGR